MSTGIHRVAVIGASGFTGAELLRICALHPTFEVVVATGESTAGVAVADLYPSLAARYPELTYTPADPAVADGCDIAFLGLPHGASQSRVPDLLDRVGHVVDLAADFRLRDEGLYPIWYDEDHAVPDLLAGAAYGLPELFRPALADARLVAAAGCYPTASTLGLAPLLRAGAIESSGIVIDAASGLSGAGRPPKPNTTFCAADEDVTAYGLAGTPGGTSLGHRHTPEIEQVLGTAVDGTTLSALGDVSVLFTPHLVPMNRGILATCYARPTDPTLDTAAVLGLLAEAYTGEPFVIVSERSPSTKATLGSNAAHLTARVDPRTGWVVVLCAIDNLVKGASGQAVQCANAVLGLDETTGLSAIGVYP